jgi:hypothetical protein
MKFVFRPVLFAVTAAILASGVSAADSASESYLPAAQRPDPGTPDFNGKWAMATPAGAPIRVLKTADGKEPPLLPAAKAKYAANQAALKANPKSDPNANCWIQGVPRITYAPYPMLIAQDKDRVNLVYETNHTFRIVSLHRPLPKWDDNLDPHWLGYSAGHWDGKTLVIDTIGQNDKTWLDYSGLPHSEKLRVQERYTLDGPDRINGELTLTDPETFSKPWSTRFTMVRQPGYDLKESVCVRDHKM